MIDERRFYAFVRLLLKFREQPHKKLSAGDDPARRLHAATASPPLTRPKGASTPSTRALRVYAKRLNDWCLALYVLAKDARVCRQMMVASATSDAPVTTFPLMVFVCDKPRMAQRFVESGKEACVGAGAEWRVENCGDNMGTTGMQARADEEAERSPHLLDLFFLSGCFSAINSGNFQRPQKVIIQMARADF